MELTIDQALQQGIEAHKAGQAQDADRLYTAILQAQPKHPDANHNMGILAVGVGKVQEALPFFKTALDANPNTAQFWLSYIDALIKLERLADAKTVLDQAKSNGAKGDGFDKLEQRLKEADQSRALDIAVQLRDSGEFNQAIDLLKDETNQFPEDADMLALLSHCYLLADQVEEAKLYLDNAKKIARDNASVGWNTARIKLKEKNPLEALNIAKDTSQRFPDDVEGMGVLGACLRANNEIIESLKVLNRAIELNPDYAEALINRGLISLSQENKAEALADLELAHGLKPHIKQIWGLIVSLKMEAQEYSDAIVLLINMIEIDPDDEKRLATLGLCYQHLKDFEASEEAYNKALAIKPDYAEAHINLGSALKKQGKLEEAIGAYNKALAIKPDNADAYNNMGIALEEQGKLEEAMEAYNKAVAIKPNYAKAIENSLSLAVQLLPIIANYQYEFNNCETQLNSEVLLGPKYQIYNAIKAYLEADFSHADSHNNNFKACDRNLFGRLDPKGKVFCIAYSSFIGQLLEATWDEKLDTENKVYHLGESHCLSYAHRNIAIDGSNFRIVPRITFGAKAFHFSRTKHDNSKAITKAHFVSLPKNSKVFLSYGEIDCRPNEGFISAATKLDKSLEELIDQTTEGYVKWFLEQNADQRHRLYFVSVPAPTYNKKHSYELNLEVARTVALFNTALKKYSLQHGFDMVDVFNFTAGSEGFSNGLFHVDDYHLGAKVIAEIERQLS